MHKYGVAKLGPMCQGQGRLWLSHVPRPIILERLWPIKDTVRAHVDWRQAHPAKGGGEIFRGSLRVSYGAGTLGV